MFNGLTLQNDCALCENFEAKPSLVSSKSGYCIQVCLMNSYFVRHKNTIIINKSVGLHGTSHGVRWMTVFGYMKINKMTNTTRVQSEDEKASYNVNIRGIRLCILGTRVGPVQK